MKNLGKLKNRLIAAALAAILALAFTACAVGSDDDAVRELVIGVSGNIATLDINQEAGILNYYIGVLINEGLLALDGNGRTIGGLAQTWETADYMVWDFHIRPDAKFADGSPVTVDDIIWSIERAQNPEHSPGVAIYFPDYVESTEKIDESTLRITLEGSYPSFIWAISNTGGLFVNKREWGENAASIGSPQDLLMGSGPYKVVEFVPGSHVTLVAQEHWRGEKPSIERLRFDFITDEATRLLAFTQGDIDFALNIPVEQGAQWQGVAGATVEYFADRSYYGITIDSTVPPFDNEYVRKAVAHSIDAAGIRDNILGGHASVATAITPPEQFASAIDVSVAAARLADLTYYEYNMEKAREAFTLSGVEPFATTLTYPSPYPNTGRASLVLADALSELGITLTVREITLDQWLTEVGNGEQGLAWMIYFATTAEPAEIAAWLLDGSGPFYNPANFTDPQIAALTHHVLSVPPGEGIDELIEAHDLAQAAAYYAPVWWGQSAIAWNDTITVTDFNSYTMLSENWTQHFAIK